MILLKPRRGFRRLPTGFDQPIYVFPENGISQHALNLIARDRLQDDPGILREFPQWRIKRAPHFVGAMVPRPAHVQGKLRQGLEPLDFRG